MRRILGLVLCMAILVIPVRGAGQERYVALTFDDGPSGRYTQRLLEGLQKEDVRATFLLCGYRMEQFPELTRAVYEAGHEIGYHGFSHDNMAVMSRRQIAGELERSQALLPEGCKPVFLRPPGGAAGDGVRQVAQVRRLSLLSWSVDPKDWALKDAHQVIQRVVRTVKDGDIVLLHDMSDSSVTAALEIVAQLKRRGYQFVTVSELAELRGVRLKPGESYRCFPQQ